MRREQRDNHAPLPPLGRLAAFVVAACLALPGAVACDKGAAGQAGGGGGGGGGRGKGPVVVRTLEAREEVVDRVVEITGTLGGAEEVVVSAEVDGRVERVAADLGDAVPRGGLLVQLQSTTPRLLAEQAEADYLQALAKLALPASASNEQLDAIDPMQLASVKRAEADLAEAQRNTRRVRELHQKGVVTQNDLDTVETRLRVAEAAHQAAREDAAAAVATAKSKRASLGLARKRLSDTSVSSPIAGVVSERLVSLGELVKAGQPVATVVVGDPLKLRGDVPERYAGEVRPEMEVRVGLDALGLEAQGKVSRVGPSVASESRTFRVEALVPNADGKLKPGLFARARVTVGSDETVIAVPETALSAVAGVTKVFVLEDGRARERRVDVLRKRGSDALVSSGGAGEIEAGDTIIVTGLARLFEGAEVTVDGARAAPAPAGASEGPPPSPSGAAPNRGR